MIQGRCPICSRPYAINALADLPSFPFCSDRCRLIDLGRWIDGAYVLPTQEPPRPAETAPGSGGEDDSA
jgi:endogenous inhibitor of DNA gyrase (YacG/DUF329 family)